MVSILLLREAGDGCSRSLGTGFGGLGDWMATDMKRMEDLDIERRRPAKGAAVHS